MRLGDGDCRGCRGRQRAHSTCVAMNGDDERELVSCSSRRLSLVGGSTPVICGGMMGREALAVMVAITGHGDGNGGTSSGVAVFTVTGNGTDCADGAESGERRPEDVVWSGGGDDGDVHRLVALGKDTARRRRHVEDRALTALPPAVKPSCFVQATGDSRDSGSHELSRE